MVGALQVGDGCSQQHVAAGRLLQLHRGPWREEVGQWTQGRPHLGGWRLGLEGPWGPQEAGSLTQRRAHPGVLTWPDQLGGFAGRIHPSCGPPASSTSPQSPLKPGPVCLLTPGRGRLCSPEPGCGRRLLPTLLSLNKGSPGARPGRQ